MKTINIKGKDYVMVNERIKEFRTNEAYKGMALVSDIVKLDDDCVVIKAMVLDADGKVKATGYAQEYKNASLINKTSYVENCETSAWGRALGNLGIGVDASIVSAEEMLNALGQQETPEPMPAEDFNKVMEKRFAKSSYTQKAQCEECGEDVSDKVANYSKSKFGKVLCYNCQKSFKQPKLEEIDIGDQLPF